MTVCVSEFPCKYSFQERALVAFKPRPILFIMNKICLNQLYKNGPLFTSTAYMEKLLGTIVKDELSSIVSPVQLYYSNSTPAL